MVNVLPSSCQALRLSAERLHYAPNFDIISKELLIKWLRHGSSIFCYEDCNIKHLDKAIDNKIPSHTFSAFGSICSCKVAQNEMGEGYGFVHFEIQDAVNTAIKTVHGMLLNGKKELVDKFMYAAMVDGPSQLRTNLYVWNFRKEFDEEQLEELFAPYGNINSPVVMKDATGPSRGFVSFECYESAIRAIEGLSHNDSGFCVVLIITLRERMDFVTLLLGKRKERRLPGVTVRITKLEEGIDDARLREEFSKFGTVYDAKVSRNKTGGTKGLGFVTFSSQEEAMKAMKVMNGHILKTKPLSVTLNEDNTKIGPKLTDANAKLAPGSATFVDINGYFEHPVSREEFVKTLEPCLCFDAHSKPTLCFVQCHAALRILGLVGELEKKVDTALQTLESKIQRLFGYFTDPDTAERKLQNWLSDYFDDLSKIATGADPHHRHFELHVEPCVYSYKTERDKTEHHRSDIAVCHVSPNKPANVLFSVSNGRLCILVELKYARLESRRQMDFQGAFAQLIHAAALAFKAKQWDKQLCCCLGSLNHWHMFLLEVVKGPEDSPAFRISHYNEFAVPRKLFDDKNPSWSEVIRMYNTLFQHLLLWLLVGRMVTPVL